MGGDTHARGLLSVRRLWLVWLGAAVVMMLAGLWCGRIIAQ